MVICFLCKTFFVSLDAFKAHLGIAHKRSEYRTLICNENNCGRKFQLFNSFRRHLLSHSHIASTSAANLNLHETDPNFVQSDQNQDFFIDTQPSHSFQIHSQSTSTTDTPEQILEKSLSLFIAKLYADQNLPRNVVQIFIDGFRDSVLKSIIKTIENSLQDSAVNNSIPVSHLPDVTNRISNIIALPFDKFSTEYKRLTFFEQQNTYVKPLSIVIGERMDTVKQNGIRRLMPVTCEQSFISLRQVLKLFFSLDGVLIETLNYMNILNNRDSPDAAIENFIQGSYWKNVIHRYGDNIVMPLFMYFDDYETGNVLGSRSGQHKLGAVYIALPCLPPHRSSMLNHIFLILLFHSSDRMLFGNQVIFQCVIDELNYLSENGIDFDVPGFKGKIYFELGLLLGDNLGIHSITGFLESFSANFPCRICKAKKDILKYQCEEDVSLLRNKQNYESDLVANNPSETGIKEKCVWLALNNFSLFDQVGVDWMHDILEGVSKYIMTLIIIYYIRNAKYFSLSLLNERIQSFFFGPDERNKPCALSWENINQGNIRLSASEMLSFIRYFGLIIGEFVPKEDPFWKLYTKLREVIDMLSSTAFAKDTKELLQTQIIELNSLYLSLSNDTLKPKFHYLIHYHRAMEKFGPLVSFWSMRFEAKHRISKIAARASCNRRNIVLSVATKHQLKLNEIFLKGKLDNTINKGPTLTISSAEIQYLLNYVKCLNVNNIHNLIKSVWVTVTSTYYGEGTILIYSTNLENSMFLSFFKLTDIYIYHTDCVILKGIKLNTLNFDDHFCAYQVEEPQNKIFIVKLYRDLESPIPCNINIVMNKMYVTLRITV